MSPFVRPTVSCIALLSSLACTTTSAARQSMSRSTALPDRSVYITAAEIEATDAATAYDAIARLRPSFLMTRGSTSIVAPPPEPIVVIVDRTVVGGVSALREVNAAAVKSARRLSAADVYFKTGRSAPSGGLEVTLRPQ